MENKSQILIYQTANGATQVDVRMQDDTVWLSQNQMAVLFQTSKQNISLHIQNILDEGELQQEGTVKEYLTVQKEGTRNVKRLMQYFNLDVIISVGYRVKSHIGTHFRIWATQRLREYIIKGFVMDDERLKEARNNYFEELLSRIRDIRSSEKVFWRKVLDIYATSIDYDPNEELSQVFFKTVQNKMHWAAHGHTAAEIIFYGIDASNPNLGLTSFKGKYPTLPETEIAKNYLEEKELNILNRMVTAYLEVAELQALNQLPMYMNDWISRINDFLKMTGNEILQHAGTISHQQAIEKARAEFEKFKEGNKNELSKAEEDFIKQIETTEKKLKKKK